MSASINDFKKSSATVDKLTDGFKLITEGTFDDYFMQLGL